MDNEVLSFLCKEMLSSPCKISKHSYLGETSLDGDAEK